MGIIEELFKEIPLGVVVKERLEMAKEELEKIRSENEKFKKENEELKKINSKLMRQIAKENEFIESHGVLFKKKPDGNFEPCSFCPTCKTAMTEFPPRSNENLTCSRCGYIASFRPNKLANIRTSAVREYFERKRNQQGS